MKAYQEGTGYFLRIDTSGLAPELEYTVQISGPPESLPTEYQWLTDRGREWMKITLAEAVTGFIRFTSMMKNPDGHFVTNARPSRQDAIRLLELPDQNQARFVYRVDIPAGSEVIAGLMTSSSIVQLYVHNAADLKFYDATSTDS